MRAPLVALLCAGCASTALRAPRPPDPTRGAPELVQTRSRVDIHREDPERGPPAAAELAKERGGWVQALTMEEALVRVPIEQLDGFLADLPRLGKVADRQIVADDVTEAHRDLVLRLDNLAKARSRYLELLQSTKTTAEAAVIERELERVTVEIERLEAQRQTLEKRARFAGIALKFSRETRPGPVGWVFSSLFGAVKWLLVWD